MAQDFDDVFDPNDTVQNTMESVIEGNCVSLQTNFEGETDPSVVKHSQLVSNTTEQTLKIYAQTGGGDVWHSIYNFSDGQVVIHEGQIITDMIGDSQVSNEKILDKAITTEKIYDGAVSTLTIGDSQVTSDKIADSNVLESKLAPDSVTTGKISNLSVTNDKLAATSVTGDKIAVGTITGDRIGNYEINTDQLASDSVAGGKIKPYAVIANRISDDARKPSIVLDQHIEPSGCHLRRGILVFDYPSDVVSRLPGLGFVPSSSSNGIIAGDLYIPRNAGYLHFIVDRNPYITLTFVIGSIVGEVLPAGGASKQIAVLDLTTVTTGILTYYYVEGSAAGGDGQLNSLSAFWADEVISL